MLEPKAQDRGAPQWSDLEVSTDKEEHRSARLLRPHGNVFISLKSRQQNRLLVNENVFISNIVIFLPIELYNIIFNTMHGRRSL